MQDQEPCGLGQEAGSEERGGSGVDTLEEKVTGLDELPLAAQEVAAKPPKEGLIQTAFFGLLQKDFGLFPQARFDGDLDLELLKDFPREKDAPETQVTKGLVVEGLGTHVADVAVMAEDQGHCR